MDFPAEGFRLVLERAFAGFLQGAPGFCSDGLSAVLLDPSGGTDYFVQSVIKDLVFHPACSGAALGIGESFLFHVIIKNESIYGLCQELIAFFLPLCAFLESDLAGDIHKGRIECLGFFTGLHLAEGAKPDFLAVYFRGTDCDLNRVSLKQIHQIGRRQTVSVQGEGPFRENFPLKILLVLPGRASEYLASSRTDIKRPHLISCFDRKDREAAGNNFRKFFDGQAPVFETRSLPWRDRHFLWCL